jgi:hypothetical protein
MNVAFLDFETVISSLASFTVSLIGAARRSAESQRPHFSEKTREMGHPPSSAVRPQIVHSLDTSDALAVGAELIIPDLVFAEGVHRLGEGGVNLQDRVEVGEIEEIAH